MLELCLVSMLSCISLAKRANIIADEWATGKFDGRANAHPDLPLATPLLSESKYLADF